MNILKMQATSSARPKREENGERENVFLNSNEPLYQIHLHHGQGFTFKIN